MRSSFSIPRKAYVEAIERGISTARLDQTPAADRLRALGKSAKRIAFGYTQTSQCYCPLARLGYVNGDTELTPKGERAGISDSAMSSFIVSFDTLMSDAAKQAATTDPYAGDVSGVARVID